MLLRSVVLEAASWFADGPELPCELFIAERVSVEVALLHEVVVELVRSAWHWEMLKLPFFSLRVFHDQFFGLTGGGLDG